MKMKRGIILLALVLVSVVAVAPEAARATEVIPGGAEFEFGGLRFGQGAPKEMICIGGACLKTEDGKPPKSPISSYKFPKDITFFGGIEISPPVYDFFEDRLLRVRFNLLCRPQDASRCIDALFAALEDDFGVAERQEFAEELSPGLSSSGRVGLLGSGDVVTLRRESRAGILNAPAVWIENPALMDALRQAVNPAYVPRPSRFSSDGR